MQQGSAEWLQSRLGKVTASRVSDVVAKTKSGYSASRANYLAQLVCERLTGQPQDSFQSAAMEWGTEHEPEARMAYEFLRDATVTQAGFIEHPKMAAGASPDGLVGEDGMVEIKCPNTATHIQTLLTEKVPAKYVKQMQWQMYIAEREWCDFASYDPRVPEAMRLWVKRVHRDHPMIEELVTEVSKFLDEVSDTVESLSNKYLETATC
jgi:putative phage-type endonuclease